MNTNYPCLTDDDLIQGLKEKNLQMLGVLYDRYAGALLGVIGRILEEDQRANALHSVFINAWCSVDEYDPRRGRLFIWLINLARKHATAIRAANGFYEDNSNLRNELNISAICDPKENLLIDMFYYKGYSASEIAEKLDLPRETVLKFLRIAVSELRKKIL